MSVAVMSVVIIVFTCKGVRRGYFFFFLRQHCYWFFSNFFETKYFVNFELASKHLKKELRYSNVARFIARV